MKLIIATTTALLIGSGPAVAQWNYDPTQAAALTICSNLAAGRSMQDAAKAASRQMVMAAGGGFTSALVTIMNSGRDVMATARYLAEQQCPQHFPSLRPLLPQTEDKWGTQEAAPAGQP